MMKESISIVATFTTDPIHESLKFLADQLGQQLDVFIGPYGQVFQQLLEPGSDFVSRKSGWNIVLLRVDDLLNPDDLNGGYGAVSDEVKVQRLSKEFSAAAVAYSRVAIVPLLVVIAPSKAGVYARLSEQFTQSIVEATGNSSTVHLCPAKKITDLYPVEPMFDDEGDRFGHVPYTDAFFVALASYILRYITMISRPEKKVLVLDCDNTLWKGVCGEDGHQGVTIDGGHQFLQAFLLQQIDMGRLLCLASKNVESDVQAVFKQNPQMLIAWDKLVAWKVNWQPKSENLQALAKELDLGLESFVFLDDNPVEIAEVAANCPQVLAIQVPKDDREIPHLLKHVWAFDKYRVTEEDKKRAKSYHDNVKRQQLQTETASFADFLKKLDLQIDIKALTPAHRARVAQLSQRTNQFNTTTRRHDELALRSFLNCDGAECHTVHVKDRFGDYGLVGIIMTTVTENNLLVTDFMLSCRALGKGVEHKMLSYAGTMACQQEFSQVIVQFVPSKRNDPALQFLNSVESEKKIAGNTHYYQFAANSLLALELQAVKPRTKIEDKSNRDNASSRAQSGIKSSASDVPSDLQIMKVGTLCGQPLNVVDALSNKVGERPLLQQAFSKPKEGVEISLARIWQRVLRLDKVGRNDRFVDLGGNSLLLVKIHSLILAELGIDVPITALFKFATVSALADHLQSDEGKDNRMTAAKERALKSRAATRANMQNKSRKING